MDLELTTDKYKHFLIEFRKADIQNAASKSETTVNVAGASYHFRAPNFQLVAYTINNQRFDLTDYNHVDVPKSIDFGKLSNALSLGGNGQTRMNGNLSTVVAFTSEAARSKVVEHAFIKVLLNQTMMLSDYEVLFKAYNQPARFNGFLNQDNTYNSTWRALRKEDYLHFFNSQEYTGSFEKIQSEIVNL